VYGVLGLFFRKQAQNRSGRVLFFLSDGWFMGKEKWFLWEMRFPSAVVGVLIDNLNCFSISNCLFPNNPFRLSLGLSAFL
jgi:hypothetical protein